MPEEKNEQEIILEEDSDAIDGKIKKLKEKLAHCQKEKQEYLTGWQRAQADFVNYKRRQEEQMGEWSKMFGEGLIKDILPVLDALEPRNYAEHDAEQRGREIIDGLKMTREQLRKVLKKYGLEEIKSVGEKFNPDLHEAVETMENENNGESGLITEEAQKGYLLNGKVLRVAKVKVTKN